MMTIQSFVALLVLPRPPFYLCHPSPWQLESQGQDRVESLAVCREGYEDEEEEEEKEEEEETGGREQECEDRSSEEERVEQI